MRTKTLSRWMLAWTLAALLTATARADDGPSAGELFEQAVAAQSAGQTDVARKRYEALLESHGDSPLAPRALLDLARLLSDERQTAAAEALVERGRSQYAEVPGFIDQLDALAVHIQSRSGKPGRRAMERYQDKITDMRRQAAEARAAGKMEEAARLEEGAARLERRYGGDEMGMGGMDRAEAARKDEVEGLRAEQEALIAKAHELEDEGKVEEAYALRRQADEIAARLEAAGKGRGGKDRGDKDMDKAKGARQQLRKQLKELTERRGALSREVEAAKAAGDEPRAVALLAELTEVEAQIKATEDKAREMGRKGEPSGEPEGKGNKAERELRKQLNEARKALKAAREAGDEAAFQAARERVEALKQQAREMGDSQSRASDEAAMDAGADAGARREAQLERLQRALERKGLSEAEVGARMAFARAEQERAEAFREAVRERQKALRQEGAAGEELKAALQAMREGFQREQMELREALEAKLAAEREAAAEAPATPREDDRRMSRESEDNDKQQERLERFAEKLRKRGLPEDEIARRVEDTRRKATEAQSAEKGNKNRGNVRELLAEQERRIAALEATVAELQKQLEAMRGAAPSMGD